MKPKSYVVFFDIDKTVLKINSAKVLVIEAYKRKMMSFSDLMYALKLSLLYKLNLSKTTAIINNMTRWMKGVDEKLFKNFALEIVNSFLIQSIRPEIRHEINAHQKNGGHLAVLSSALPEICFPLAKHLNIDSVICSQLEVIDGLFTGYAKGKLCFGKEKQVKMNDFCNVHGYKINEAWYYADSIADAPVLFHVGIPVCVKPDNKLKKIAKKNKWKML